MKTDRVHWWLVKYRLLALVALLTAAVSWLWAHEGHAPLPTRGAQVDVEKGVVILSAEARDALGLETAEVSGQPIRESVTAYANVVAPWQRHAFASSRLPGRVVAIHIQAGQTIKAGQPLAEVASLDLENLQLELLNTRNDIRLAEQIIKNLRDPSAAVSGQSILDAEVRLQQLRNNFDVAKSKWRALQLSTNELNRLLNDADSERVATLPVRAPIDGTVVHADLSLGQVIESGEHLFEIVDLSKVWARIGVLEADLPRVQISQQVELRLSAYPGKVFASAIRVKGLILDPKTFLNNVWAEFDNPQPGGEWLRPGMSGQARILLPQTAVGKYVPADALINDGLERYVLIEQARAEQSSEYLKTPVVVLRESAQSAEVQAASLFPGTRVVTQGAHELSSYFVPGVLRVTPETARTIGLKVAPIQQRVVEETVDVDGIVEIPPVGRTFASAQLSGNIARIVVDVGQPVEANQLLGEVVSLELHNLQLDLLEQHLKLQSLELQYRDLKPSSSISPRRVLEVESERNGTRNRRDNIRRRLEVLGLSDDQITGVLERKRLVNAVPIRAPARGVVVHFDKVIGEHVKAGEPLFEVHDLSRPLVQAFLSERDLSKLRFNQPARVRFVSAPGEVHTGKTVRSSEVVGAEAQSLSAWVALDSPPPEPLRHQQLARVTLTVEQPPPVLALPKAAVLHNGIRAFVFVQKDDGTFDRRAVETGRSDDRFVEIRRGLSAGERVAIGGAAELWTAYSSLR